MSEYYWVPENAIFENAADATEFMDLGAGTLVANHTRYEELKAKLEKIAGMCGHPDSAQACRNILKEIKGESGE